MIRRLALAFSVFLMASTAIAVAPARAQSNDQIGRALAAGFGLFVLGQIISSQNDKEKAKAAAKSKASSKSPTGSKLADQDERKLQEQWSKFDWPHRPEVNRKVLPRDCFFLAGFGENRVGVFGQSCLHEKVRNPGSLPKQCRITIPVRHGGSAKVYSARCMRENGYTMEVQQAGKKRKKKK